jgi:hypothetical protein
MPAGRTTDGYYVWRRWLIDRSRDACWGSSVRDVLRWLRQLIISALIHAAVCLSGTAVLFIVAFLRNGSVRARSRRRSNQSSRSAGPPPSTSTRHLVKILSRPATRKHQELHAVIKEPRGGFMYPRSVTQSTFVSCPATSRPSALKISIPPEENLVWR